MPPAQRMYTLTEVSKATGISMPTLQRYKKLYQERIPSVGEGRKQRYPKKAFAVLKKIREENMKKRGRPAKAAGGSKAKAKAKTKTKTKTRTKTRTRKAKAGRPARSGAVSGGAENLLTLLEIGRRTGISYPTLLRYVKLHGDEIPHVGSGRRRRYRPEAVAVFRRIRKSSKRGPRSGKGRSSASRHAVGTDQQLKARVRDLEKAQRQVARQLDDIIRLLKKPMKITVRSD